MESDWSLLPGVGLGRLKFGMPPEAYDEFEGIYGKVEWEEKHNPPSEKENRDFEEYLKHTNEEDREKEERYYKENSDFLSKIIIKYAESGLQISYHDHKLYSIMGVKRCTKLHLNGLPVFLSDPEEVVLEFARTLNENPLVDGTDTVFRESHVYLFGFTKGLNWRGKLSYYSLADANDTEPETDAQQRSLSWGTRPRNVVPEDWSQHVLVPLIQP